MGLHKDGTEMNCDAVTTHIRRMIWYELLLLDTRAYEAHGPQLLVREDSFTTKLPLNVNDDDLERERPPCEDSDTWTDMTLTRIRMECDRVIRKIYVDRDRLGSADGRIILTDVLCYIAQFRRTMMEKYVPMINDSNSLQYYAQLNIDLHTRRMHAIMLQRYHGMGGLERMPGKHILLRFSFSAETDLIDRSCQQESERVWYCDYGHRQGDRNLRRPETMAMVRGCSAPT